MIIETFGIKQNDSEKIAVMRHRYNIIPAPKSAGVLTNVTR